MQLRNADQQERDAEATLADIMKAVDGLAGTLVVVAARLKIIETKVDNTAARPSGVPIAPGQLVQRRLSLARARLAWPGGLVESGF